MLTGGHHGEKRHHICFWLFGAVIIFTNRANLLRLIWHLSQSVRCKFKRFLDKRMQWMESVVLSCLQRLKLQSVVSSLKSYFKFHMIYYTIAAMKIHPHTSLHWFILHSTLVPLRTQQPAVAALRNTSIPQLQLHLQPLCRRLWAGGAQSHSSHQSTLQRTASKHRLLYDGQASSLIVVKQKALDVELYCPE